MHVLKAGTVLYHGTSDPEFLETIDGLRGPAWLTDDESVAAGFAQRALFSSPSPRVLQYILEEDVELHLLEDENSRYELEHDYHIDFSSAEDMCDSVKAAGIPGWFIPSNYPGGAVDILIANTRVLRYQVTRQLQEPKRAARRPKA
ncbi:hypothetical protein [Roseateles asaccharophilus]|uniref:hypothetical protein n=1 Tax=Roseateles asaccharophilus TaxID=582607 RepID=UPI00384D1A99